MRQAVHDWDNQQGVYLEMSPENRTLKELHTAMHVPMPEIQSLRICLEMAIEDPSHLKRELPSVSTSTATDQVSEVKAKLSDVADGLVSTSISIRRRMTARSSSQV